MAGWSEKAVFLAALNLAPEDREAFLEGACPDEGSRERVNALLRAHAASGTRSGTDAPPDLRLGPGIGAEAVAVAFGAPGSTANNEIPIDPDDPNIGREFDDFRILRVLGRGGMGIVYLARDIVLGRHVALKILADHMSDSERALSRFRQEARSTAMLRHPGIVPVFRLGHANNRHYIVSEFVNGPTLASVIQEEQGRRELSPIGTTDYREWYRRSANIVAELANALEHSHRAQIIHRDVKPSNVLLDPDIGPRLTDFGIAAHLADDMLFDRTDVIGSYHYMSPEQASVAERDVDQRSDVFSLGVVLYELLTLKRPFDGSDPPRVLHAVVSETPTRPTALVPRLSKDLETICMKALEKRPNERYQSMAHFEAELRSYLSGLPILARPPGMARKVGRWTLRHRLPLAISAIVLLAFTVTVGAYERISYHQSTQAWVQIDAPDQTDVFVQRWSGFRAADDWQPVGTAPLAVKRLEPGQYRFLAVSPDGTSFAEWNALLLESGREALTVLNVSTDSASGPENASADNVEDRLTGGDANQGQPDLARVLQARFIPTSEVIEGMVYVEPGVYRVSTEQGPTENRELPGVYIDRTEVTNADYQVFVQATGAAEPYYWRFADDFDAIADLPVMWIPFEDAEAYARWQGKRLPTLEEWQAAARGPDRHLYPGGLETPPDVIHGERGHNPETIYTAYIANVVDARVPAEWDDADGLLHLYSNVREKTGTVNLTRRSAIIAGRGWSDPVAQFSLESWGTGPFDFPEPRTGFRCAKSDPATLNEKGMMSE